MILMPILLPVMMGMLVAVIAMGAVLFGTLATALVSGGASAVRAHRRRGTESPQAVPELTAIPGTAYVGVEEDIPEAA